MKLGCYAAGRGGVPAVATAVPQLRPLQSPRGRRDRAERGERGGRPEKFEKRRHKKEHEKETLKQRLCYGSRKRALEQIGKRVERGEWELLFIF